LLPSLCDELHLLNALIESSDTMWYEILVPLNSWSWFPIFTISKGPTKSPFTDKWFPTKSLPPSFCWSLKIGNHHDQELSGTNISYHIVSDDSIKAFNRCDSPHNDGSNIQVNDRIFTHCSTTNDIAYE